MITGLGQIMPYSLCMELMFPEDRNCIQTVIECEDIDSQRISIMSIMDKNDVGTHTSLGIDGSFKSFDITQAFGCKRKARRDLINIPASINDGPHDDEEEDRLALYD